MKFLLDVNVLMGAIWKGHTLHERAKAWVEGKKLVTCPVTELGFIRISTNQRALALPMADVRETLARFLKERNVEQIPDDLPALDSHAKTSSAVTDQYLADLAAKHGLKLATLDGAIAHPAIERIS